MSGSAILEKYPATMSNDGNVIQIVFPTLNHYGLCDDQKQKIKSKCRAAKKRLTLFSRVPLCTALEEKKTDKEDTIMPSISVS